MPPSPPPRASWWFPIALLGLEATAALSLPAADTFGFARYTPARGPRERRSVVAQPTPAPSKSSRAGGLVVLPSSPSSEFGAISSSSSEARLSPELIDAALERLPWETDDDGQAETPDTVASGEQWYDTRRILTRLWVLPRDMSNGSWEAYAAAANRGEDEMLSRAPQLLRLGPGEVEASAKTVLKELRLPPALLRRDPSLLTMPSDRLRGGFDALLLEEAKKASRESGDDEVTNTIREACKDTPGLLLEAATKWESSQ